MFPIISSSTTAPLPTNMFGIYYSISKGIEGGLFRFFDSILK